MRRKPGYRWRLLAHNDKSDQPIDVRHDRADGVCFDELVVDGWLHIEQMSARQWWMDIAGLTVNVWIKASGVPEVMLEVDDPGRHTLRSYL